MSGLKPPPPLCKPCGLSHVRSHLHTRLFVQERTCHLYPLCADAAAELARIRQAIEDLDREEFGK